MRAGQIAKTFLGGAIALGTLAGCSSNAGTGALAGGAAGAGLGAIIGHQSHGHTAGGALIGGALGAIGGAIVGSEIDHQQAEARDREYGERYYYEDRPYYRDRYYYGPPPAYYETRTYDPYTHTTYIERHYY